MRNKTNFQLLLHVKAQKSQSLIFLPTVREGNVFTGVRQSVHNRPDGYSVTARPCYSVVGMHPTGILPCSEIIFDLAHLKLSFTGPDFQNVTISVRFSVDFD